MDAILLAFLGLAAGILAWLLICKPLTKHGYPLWGLLLGLGAVFGSYLLANLPFVIEYHRSFARIGPCSLCYEWSGMPFLFTSIGWGMGALLYLVLAPITLIRAARTKPGRLFKTPAHLWMAMLVFTIAAGLLVVSELFYRQVQKKALIDALQATQSNGSFTGIVELGSLPLAAPFSFSLQPRYVESSGMMFSPDGRWLALSFEDGLELWNWQDLSRQSLYRERSSSKWGGQVTFSPDGSLLAYSARQELRVLNLESRQSQWQSRLSEPVQALRFDHQGSSLLVQQPSAVQRLWASDGRSYSQTALSPPGGFPSYRLDTYGERAVTAYQGEFLLVDTSSGQEVVRYRVPDSQKERAHVYGQNGFLQDGRILFWGSRSGVGNASFVLDPSSKTAEPLVLSILPGEYAAMAFDPQAKRGVLATGRSAVIVDLESLNEAGSLPVSAAVTALAFSPDGRILAVSCADGRLHVFALLEKP